MLTKASVYRYISIVAAMCMVLYGYDASTFNSIQASDNWLNWFGLTSDSTYLLGLINTVYSIGAIVSGWFLGGPVVSCLGVSACVDFQLTNTPGRLFGTSLGHGAGLLRYHLCHHDADLRSQGQPRLFHGRSCYRWYRARNGLE